jgi:hypothetical protein
MSRCLVVMQPTVLPWAGYFNLMAQADNFIFHDDIQLEKRSWQTRNRLIFGGKPSWISLPIRHISERQTIIETEVLIDKKWRGDLDRTFARNYGGHEYYGASREVLDLLLSNDNIKLSKLNETIICFIAEKLKISPRIHLASNLNLPGVRSERLIAFCRNFNAEEYLSPIGSAEYLAMDHFSEDSKSRLRFQNYNPKPYLQKTATTFVSHLSVLDIIANLGWDKTRDYVME